MDLQVPVGIHLLVIITVPHPLITILPVQGGVLNILRVLITAPLPILTAHHHFEDGAILPCGGDLLGSEEVLHTGVIILMVPHPP